MSNIQIRKATPNDMDKVLELIRELAIYENAEEQVSNTADQLRKDGFGEHPRFECFVADEENEVIGFALFYTSYSTWKGTCLYLEDLLVTESKRRSGIGKLLFDKVLETAKERGAKRFEWQVLDWNEPAISFYKKYNADLDPEWINGKIFL
ncbi:GNAT family N-acetyltransferase [Paracrocinitomix mangrovi]|uniref:GNAT family N-acetyltransferase n=1 Tax=Paracrocinitomix mangrovi TaxID=2862509 RepID=UPI001C8DD878|nr:GNAT family N-acetyltransferase [Paracrocinitomix mangrovi]UKN00889.1 GNAT family N-acetyltransferase [Paracrocinitomix mangrovi]